MDRERQARVLQLLEDNVRSEIEIWNAARTAGLDAQQVEELAGAIAANVGYAFAVDWSPDWVKEGDVHAWEDAGSHFARCSLCLDDSPASATRGEAVAWARSHVARH